MYKFYSRFLICENAFTIFFKCSTWSFIKTLECVDPCLSHYLRNFQSLFPDYLSATFDPLFRNSHQVYAGLFNVYHWSLRLYYLFFLLLLRLDNFNYLIFNFMYFNCMLKTVIENFYWIFHSSYCNFRFWVGLIPPFVTYIIILLSIELRHYPGFL